MASEYEGRRIYQLFLADAKIAAVSFFSKYPHIFMSEDLEFSWKDGFGVSQSPSL